MPGQRVSTADARGARCPHSPQAAIDEGLRMGWASVPQPLAKGRPRRGQALSTHPRGMGNPFGRRSYPFQRGGHGLGPPCVDVHADGRLRRVPRAGLTIKKFLMVVSAGIPSPSRRNRLSLPPTLWPWLLPLNLRSWLLEQFKQSDGAGTAPVMQPQGAAAQAPWGHILTQKAQTQDIASGPDLPAARCEGAAGESFNERRLWFAPTRYVSQPRGASAALRHLWAA